MRYIKIESKKVQNLESKYTLSDYNDGFDNKFIFHTENKVLRLKAPKGTVNAKLINGEWFWEIKEETNK